MEMGGSNYDDEINKYLLSPNLSVEQSNQKALEIQRKATWYPLWERYNYHYLLTSLYAINKPLPTQKKIKLHPTDIAIRWNDITTPTDIGAKIMNFKLQLGRDSVMASNIISSITRINASGSAHRKYFVLLNSAHATKGTYSLGKFPNKSAATYVFEKFGDRVANVLINFESILNMTSTVGALPETLPILNGKLDAAFEFLGEDDKGFDMKGSPLAGHRFENMLMLDTTLTNDQVFTGFVFYESFPRHENVNGVPGLVDASFKPELERRYKLWQQLSGYYPAGALEEFNTVRKKSPAGLATFWKKVMYWIDGGKAIQVFNNTAKSLDETIGFIKAERAKGSNSDYNVSLLEINAFGYYLLRQQKLQDALTIFRLNTEIFPDSWITHYSYGEALLKAGKKEDAIREYKKSVELNPDNENGKLILEKIK